MEPYQIVLATLGAAIVLKLLVLLVLGGGSLSRLGVAWQAFRRVMGDAAVAAKVQPLLVPPDPSQKPKRSGEPLRLLTVLQRDGRLLDFFLEDISAYTDNDLGVGVRELHRKSQAALKEHLVLEPVMPQEEGESVQVPAGFDLSAIRLTGNVHGDPPFRGTVKHRGWRVKDYKLAAPPEGQDEFVVFPAEVEIP